MKVEKKKRKRAAQEEEEEEEDGELGDLYFRGIAAYFVETGIQPRRLQVSSSSYALDCICGDANGMCLCVSGGLSIAYLP